MSTAALSPVTQRGTPRWLLLGSLALNLFFIGAAIALAIRPPPPPPAWDRDAFVRLERLAEALPAADAAILRGAIKTNRANIENTQTDYRGAQGKIRATLRQEPFDAAAMRAAMTDARSARQNFDQAIQGVFANAAAQMSPSGRNVLADWPPGRKSAGDKP